MLVDKECFKKVDKQARKFDLVESLDDDHKVMYSHYKGMYTVADRDFVYFRGKKDMDDGNKLLYATFSVDTHPIEPVKGPFFSSFLPFFLSSFLPFFLSSFEGLNPRCCSSVDSFQWMVYRNNRQARSLFNQRERP